MFGFGVLVGSEVGVGSGVSVKVRARVAEGEGVTVSTKGVRVGSCLLVVFAHPARGSNASAKTATVATDILNFLISEFIIK